MDSGQQNPAEQPTNPYQQAGYHQQNPYAQQPTAAWPSGDGSGGAGGGNHRLKMTLAVTAAVAMVAGVTVGGFLLVNSDDGDGAPRAGQSPAPEPDPDGDDDTDTDTDGDGDDGPPDDPRGGVRVDPDPVVDGWQTMPNVTFNNVFDVPAEWTLNHGHVQGWEKEVDGEQVYTLMSEPAVYLAGFCGPGTERAIAGTRGARGWEASTEHTAEVSAREFALAAYDQDEKGTLTEQPPEPFTNDQGFEGHIAVATIEDFPHDETDECAAPSGEVIAISYLNASSNIMTWLLVRDTGIEEELDRETVDTILSSLRWHEE